MTSSGRSPIEEFLEECTPELRSDFVDALSMLEEGCTLQMPLSKNLASVWPGLHELRLKDRNGQIRIFYYIKRREGIYILHAIKKKSQQLPKKEIDLVCKRLKEV